MIISQTPVRISFAGGGTDLPAFYEREGGAVVSATIDRYAYAALSARPDGRLRITSEDLLIDETYANLDELPESLELIQAVLKRQRVSGGLHLHLESEIPVGSGLGLSSAVCVNLLNLLFHHRGESVSKSDLAWLASEIEIRDLGRPIGRQDHYAAAFGGLNLIEFTRDGVAVRPLNLSEETLRTLESRLLLFFTGRTRDSASILRGQEQHVREGQPQTLAALRRLKQLAYEIVAALEDARLNDFGDLLHESWVTKQRLSDRIGSPQIAAWYELARELGARGGKISGAGGGGYLLLYAEEERHALIREVLTTLGLQELPFRFDHDGSRIIHREGAGMTPRGYLVGLNSIVRGLS
ncbi:MAG: GHMP kinase, partial [Calditrichaeota bacterium]|nr:GHMP kinase [Calditrichota bacterium]